MKRTNRACTPTRTRLAMVASVSLAACAGTPLTTEAPTAEIRAAQEVGAADVPQAALHLQLAEEELARAKHLSSEGDDKAAASMLTRSLADAELAVALARNNAEQQAAMDAIARVRELRSDTDAFDSTLPTTPGPRTNR